MSSVGDSQKDLISVTVSDSPGVNNNNVEKMFKVTNTRERRLMGGLLVSLLGRFCRFFENNHLFAVISILMSVESAIF